MSHNGPIMVSKWSQMVSKWSQNGLKSKCVGCTFLRGIVAKNPADPPHLPDSTRELTLVGEANLQRQCPWEKVERLCLKHIRHYQSVWQDNLDRSSVSSRDATPSIGYRTLVNGTGKHDSEAKQNEASKKNGRSRGVIFGGGFRFRDFREVTKEETASAN